jgi:uncharacterized protein YcbK (DUF882 family)
MNLSEHFTLDEFLHSEAANKHGIRMLPPQQAVANLRLLVAHVMQPLRYAIGRIQITSGWRPPEVNRLVGGAPRSDHVQGRACDFRPLDVDYIEAGKVLETMTFDQLIYYHAEHRLHVGYRHGKNRQQVLHKQQGG